MTRLGNRLSPDSLLLSDAMIGWNQSLSRSFDVVIAGGGVIGSAVAYFLAAHPDFDGRVCVVERDPSYQSGATARSAGSIRQQFSTPENIRMSQFGVTFLKALGETLAVEGERPDVQLQEGGYLFLASVAGLETLRANHTVQQAEGAPVTLLDCDGLAARFPWLNLEGLAAGCFGTAEEGWFDPFALLQAFRRKAVALGVTYLADEVVDIARQGHRIGAVELAAGGRLGCGWLVNAAGIRARDLARMAGIEGLPVHPRKRQVFVFNCREPLPGCPLIIDPSGLYVRPEGSGFICGISPGPGEPDPDCDDLEVDHGLFEERLWPLLAARVPAFEAIKPAGAWAGHYDLNSFDANAILGAHPELPNFLFANGFSGHGLQQSPAVGRALAELIAEGRYVSLDLSRFGYERIAATQPIIEKNVV
ncbi:NAD(P)/FAD-dependent oxidoreductase [Algihabitans albus]|uniref:NAD(P)/FAD-dependent oxidoreductase n=1 Tax=Algihabitans albus TaxID=2164067 RepID=UPI002E265C2E